MNRRDVALTGLIALGTAALALICSWPAGTVAVDPAGTGTPEIVWPTLSTGNAQITLRTTEATLAPGDLPVVVLDVSSKTGSSVALSGVVRMMAQVPPNPGARSIALPTTAWQETCSLTTDGRQTSSILLHVPTQVPERSMVFFTLRVGEVTISTRPLVNVPALMDGVPIVAQVETQQ